MTLCVESNSDKMIEILRKTKVQMNGAVVDSMRERGIVYPLSYGVSLPTLKDIAEPYKGDHGLALFLYRQDIREMKLIASIIDNPAEVTREQMWQWAEDFKNNEIVEIVSSTLFWQTPYALTVSMEWLLEGKELLIKSALIIAGKIAKTKTVEQKHIKSYIDLIDSITSDKYIKIKDSFVFALRNIAQNSEDMRSQILELIDKFTLSNSEIKRYIASECSWQIKQ